MTSLPIKKIVIVGGGAGGLELATSLGHKLGRNKKAEITLVDRNHSHLWKPLLHEVATGSLDEGVDALSYLAHARNHDFQFQLGSVVDINRETKTITLAELHNEKGELLVAVVPQVIEQFTHMKQQLPITTRTLVGWSRTTPIEGHVLSTPYPEVIAEAVARGVGQDPTDHALEGLLHEKIVADEIRRHDDPIEG